MITVSIRIEHDAIKDKPNSPYVEVACDILKREDADAVESVIAKSLEESIKEESIKIILNMMDKDAVINDIGDQNDNR